MAHTLSVLLTRSASENVRARRDTRKRRSEPHQEVKPHTKNEEPDGKVYKASAFSQIIGHQPSVATPGQNASDKALGNKSLSFASMDAQQQNQQHLFEAVRSNSPLAAVPTARHGDSLKRGVLPPRFTLVEHGSVRFLLSDSPRPDELSSFMSTWRKSGVKCVVLACRPQYEVERLTPAFEVKSLDYEDGSVPSDAIVMEWLNRVDEMERANSEYHSDEVIAVHCKTGLGRAPLLVAIALIEYGMNPLEAVGLIRSLRRGAINVKQLQFLDEYVRRADRAGGAKTSPSLMQRAKNVLSKSASQNGAATKRK